MNFGNLLFSPSGRIDKKAFWIGFAILLVASIVVGLLGGALGALGGLIGLLLNILIIYMSVCVYAKRLHDFGKSGWLYGAIILLTIVLALVLMWPAIAAIMEVAASDPELAQDQAAMEEMMASEVGFGRMLLMYLPTILFTLWVGLKAGDPGDNRYGPPPNAGYIA